MIVHDRKSVRATAMKALGEAANANGYQQISFQRQEYKAEYCSYSKQNDSGAFDVCR